MISCHGRLYAHECLFRVVDCEGSRKWIALLYTFWKDKRIWTGPVEVAETREVFAGSPGLVKADDIFGIDDRHGACGFLVFPI